MGSLRSRVGDICGEDSADFSEHFISPHLGIELCYDESRMVTIKVEVLVKVEESLSNCFTGIQMFKSFVNFLDNDGFKWQLFQCKWKGP